MAACVAGGVLGVMAALADMTTFLWLNAANMPGAWAFAAFLVGFVSWRAGWGAFAGVGALLIAVAVYYALLLASGTREYVDSAMHAAEVWAAVAVPTGLVMGWAGAVLAGHRQTLLAVLGAGLFAGVMWGEALVTGSTLVDAHGPRWGMAAMAEAAAGLIAILFAHDSQKMRLTGIGIGLGLASAAVAVAAALMTTVRCAAGDWCG